MPAFTVMPVAMQSFLATCSPEHVEQIIKVIQELPQRKISNPGSVMKAKHGVTVMKTGKKQRIKKTKQDGATGGPKRPLNSWMAFRSKYSPEKSLNYADSSQSTTARRLPQTRRKQSRRFS